MPNLWSIFERTVRESPQRQALVRPDLEVSFEEWHARALDFRREFQRRGIGRSDRILLWVTNVPDVAAALLAAWGQGAIAVLMDQSAPPAHFLHALETTQPGLVVVAADDALPLAPPAGTPVLHVREVRAGSDEVIAAAPTVPTDVASILFTSGSTGRPKGVAQSHGNLIRGCRTVGAYLGLRTSDRILCPVPWSFDYGYGQLLSSLVFGCTHITPHPLNPFGICAAIEAYKPTVFGGLPALYGYLVSGLSPIRDCDVSSVRLLMNTGGAIPRPVLDELLTLFKGRQFFLNYGLTETYRSCYLPAELVGERHDSIGIPIPGVDIVIVGPDGSPLEPEVPGEIVHRGDFICLGYWGDPEGTASAIRKDPLIPAGTPHLGRALHTGDLGFRDRDGFVYFLGRRDHQIKSMGVRVSATEIEGLLYESGLVSEAAVFGVAHGIFGQEVWAAVVLKGPSEKSKRDLERYAKAVMSPYMQPRKYLVETSLPRTTTGKVDYPALKERAAQP